MIRSVVCLAGALTLCLAGVAIAAAPPRTFVSAFIETTLATSSGQVRQFAFDGKPDTYFASAKPIAQGDHFTLVFDLPVKVRSVAVTTGQPKGGDELESGT